MDLLKDFVLIFSQDVGKYVLIFSHDVGKYFETAESPKTAESPWKYKKHDSCPGCPGKCKKRKNKNIGQKIFSEHFLTEVFCKNILENRQELCSGGPSVIFAYKILKNGFLSGYHW